MKIDLLYGQHFHNLSKGELDKSASKAQLKHQELDHGKEGFVIAVQD
jgi:hypothetical protein